MSNNQDRNVAAVILAAGMGKRMKSELPKVLHKLDGRFMVDYVIDNAREAGVNQIVLVVGHKHGMVEKELANRPVKFALQIPQKGTGHAVQMAVPYLGNFDGDLLVLCGDMPLVSPITIKNLIKMRHESDAAAVVLTVNLDKPGSYGRIVRDNQGYLDSIVEFKDADDSIKQIKEVNTGAYCFDYQKLLSVLHQLSAENAQAEFYLTDTIKLLKQKGFKVAALISDNPNEGFGINSIDELSYVESIIREQKR
ncbi:MAG: NTP transferase domain-containing protein [candidate division Zixibacteria bacterium]|nr:NTP transferase domain-containing protein [candidate division Zixibacteria bacterium]